MDVSESMLYYIPNIWSQLLKPLQQKYVNTDTVVRYMRLDLAFKSS